ncbi:Structural maintenance of chromosomes protein 1 [Nosema bombycis CQ1]|uniref:Structural maintenance of chromosomes protein 1 n=1 Tax=Nosema bombycis (strain CQ1 / CVCC 102059) TaxID=578461 RepID=R0KUW3_NOSB1|nr:Structural maintenance of chromosomes protein 1 [Nosema bombycis CQ1]|eukprot:EOB14666.1 Structural maintenance of chromosomes protein 1 [Nosema bombycis CQ1]
MEEDGSKVDNKGEDNRDDGGYLNNLNSLNLNPPNHNTPTNTPTLLQFLISNLNKINSQISELVPSIKHSKKSQNYEKILKNYEEAKKKAMDSRKKMNEIKRERSSIFMKCFEIVSSEIGKIYQEISKNEFTKGNAYLVLDNPTEPYLEGVRYHVMPPTKRFREIGHLSGGEKSMAILALMFSINKFMPVPFFILDEFDSALDNTNVGRMVDFFIKCNVQFLVISLKPILFQYADSLVGVYQDPNEKSSKI